MEIALNSLPDVIPDAVLSRPRSLHERQAATLAALDSFMEQDEVEHKETLRVLRQALEEDRPGQRRVFGKAHGTK